MSARKRSAKKRNGKLPKPLAQTPVTLRQWRQAKGALRTMRQQGVDPREFLAGIPQCRAAMTIQRTWRAMRAENGAASKIQAAWRLRSVWKAHRVAACVLLQSQWRDLQAVRRLRKVTAAAKAARGETKAAKGEMDEAVAAQACLIATSALANAEDRVHNLAQRIANARRELAGFKVPPKLPATTAHALVRRIQRAWRNFRGSDAHNKRSIRRALSSDAKFASKPETRHCIVRAIKTVQRAWRAYLVRQLAALPEIPRGTLDWHGTRCCYKFGWDAERVDIVPWSRDGDWLPWDYQCDTYQLTVGSVRDAAHGVFGKLAVYLVRNRNGSSVAADRPNKMLGSHDDMFLFTSFETDISDLPILVFEHVLANTRFRVPAGGTPEWAREFSFFNNAGFVVPPNMWEVIFQSLAIVKHRWHNPFAQRYLNVRSSLVRMASLHLEREAFNEMLRRIREANARIAHPHVSVCSLSKRLSHPLSTQDRSDVLMPRSRAGLIAAVCELMDQMRAVLPSRAPPLPLKMTEVCEGLVDFVHPERTPGEETNVFRILLAPLALTRYWYQAANGLERDGLRSPDETRVDLQRPPGGTSDGQCGQFVRFARLVNALCHQVKLRKARQRLRRACAARVIQKHQALKLARRPWAGLTINALLARAKAFSTLCRYVPIVRARAQLRHLRELRRQRRLAVQRALRKALKRHYRELRHDELERQRLAPEREKARRRKELAAAERARQAATQTNSLPSDARARPQPGARPGKNRAVVRTDTEQRAHETWADPSEREGRRQAFLANQKAVADQAAAEKAAAAKASARAAEIEQGKKQADRFRHAPAPLSLAAFVPQPQTLLKSLADWSPPKADALPSPEEEDGRSVISVATSHWPMPIPSHHAAQRAAEHGATRRQLQHTLKHGPVERSAHGTEAAPRLVHRGEAGGVDVVTDATGKVAITTHPARASQARTRDA